MNKEQKWKLIVLSYRDKLGRLEQVVKEERKSKAILEETLKL